MIVGYARVVDGEQYFRIQDSFTPSRSRPLPDFNFGGQDDISDAIGWQTADGQTLLKFRRSMRAPTAGDDCILPGVGYRAIYAVGQVCLRFFFCKQRPFWP